MARLFDFTKYDKNAPGVAVGPELTAELRRIANLFLVSAITLLLFLARAFAEVFKVTFIPHRGYVVWGILMLIGWAATYVYGIYVTFGTRRWGWFAFCAFPVTCVPAAAAYAWMRRLEIEHHVLGEADHNAARQKRGGRKSRR
jgi:hypothetical protein